MDTKLGLFTANRFAIAPVAKRKARKTRHKVLLSHFVM